MAECCKIIYNTDILLNEAHNNNFIFALANFPVSFLISKFGNSCLKKLGPSPADYAIFNDIEAIKETHNDIRNLALFTKSCTFPGITVQTSTIEQRSVPVPVASGKLEFTSFTTKHTLDENYFLWRMMAYWLYAAFNPEDLQNYTEIQYSRLFYVDGYVTILDNNRDNIMTWKLEHLHPKSVSPIELDYKSAGNIEFTVEWIYSALIPVDDYNIFSKV